MNLITVIIIAGCFVAAAVLVFIVIALTYRDGGGKDDSDEFTEEERAAARAAVLAELQENVEADLDKVGLPAKPQDAEAVERSKLIIHGLLMGVSENIASYLGEVNDYGTALDNHEKAIQKAKTMAALQEVERLLLSQVESMRDTTSQYQKRLDVANARIERQKDEMERLTSDAAMDFLTRIPNRRSFDKRISEEIARFRRHEQIFALVILDIDYFKRINDTFGHVAGDRILRAVASIIDDQKRESDFLARYGGEEFALILPETDVKRAMVMASKVRYKVENARLNYQGTAIKVTLSAGLTEISRSDDINMLLERADAALYRAKEAGRNLVEGSNPDGTRVE